MKKRARTLWLAFLSKIGLTTIKELNELKKKCESQNEEIPQLEDNHNFDELLKVYHPDQVNALVYRIINYTRNNPQTTHYLPRWKARLETAMNNPQYKVEPKGKFVKKNNFKS